MASESQLTNGSPALKEGNYDVIIIGSGVTGLHALHNLLKLNLSVKVFDDAGDVGGTWYWNRYPGARFDSESYSYAYGFSKQLLDEWRWSEHFAGQAEIERYLHYVADKFNLRPHIQFNTRIQSAIYDRSSRSWRVESEQGDCARARFLITAVGYQSATYIPDIPGLETFKGISLHTARWPHEKVDFSGKKVGVIGTGSTGVQVIQEVSRLDCELFVFQRTPGYVCPLNNDRIGEIEQKELQERGLEIIARARKTFAGFLHEFDPRSALDTSPEDRQTHFEKIWSERGASKWFGVFSDTYTNRQANELYAKFVRSKIREQVHDPLIAEKLIPRDYPFGAKRVPMGTEYYQSFNRANVRLVDLRETPIERINEKGISTSEANYQLDYIIFATGFDSITGQLTRMNIRGEDGQSLKDEWASGMRTYMGVVKAGFPNLFIATSAVFANAPRATEIVVDWVTQCIDYMLKAGLKKITTTPEAEADWQTHCEEILKGSILLDDKSAWFLGANIPGKKREFLMYGGGSAAYRQKCDDIVSQNYEGFVFS